MTSLQDILLELSNTTGHSDLLVDFTPGEIPVKQKERYQQQYEKFGGSLTGKQEQGANLTLANIVKKAQKGAFTFEVFKNKIVPWMAKNNTSKEYVYNAYLAFMHRLQVNPKYLAPGEITHTIKEKILPVTNSSKREKSAAISLKERRRQHIEKLNQQGRTPEAHQKFEQQHNEESNFNIGSTPRFHKEVQKIADMEVQREIYPTLKNFVNEIKRKGPNIIQNKTFDKTNILSTYDFRDSNLKKRIGARAILHKSTLRAKSKNKYLIVWIDIPKKDPPARRHLIFLGVLHHDEYWNDREHRVDSEKMSEIQKRMEIEAQKYFNQHLNINPMKESVSLKSFSQFLNEINNNRTRLLAPDPTREDLKKTSDENIQQILKKAKMNPGDLTQAEKHVLFALGKK